MASDHVWFGSFACSAEQFAEAAGYEFERLREDGLGMMSCGVFSGPSGTRYVFRTPEAMTLHECHLSAFGGDKASIAADIGPLAERLGLPFSFDWRWFADE